MIVIVAVYAVFDANVAGEPDQEIVAVYSEVSAIDETGVAPVTGTVTPAMAAVLIMVAVAGNAAVITPELMELVAAGDEPDIKNWFAPTPTKVYPAVAERVIVAV